MLKKILEMYIIKKTTHAKQKQNAHSLPIFSPHLK